MLIALIKKMAKTKTCTGCKKEKLLSEFNRNHKGKHGVQSQCKKCRTRYHIEHKNSDIDKHKHGIRRRHLKHLYNITLEQYDRMFERQNGVCAICDKPQLNKRLSVDHNHGTGKVRGLLCSRCNSLLGVIESGDFLDRAMKYLRN